MTIDPLILILSAIWLIGAVAWFVRVLHSHAITGPLDFVLIVAFSIGWPILSVMRGVYAQFADPTGDDL